MDVSVLLRNLYIEKENIERAIAALEALQGICPSQEPVSKRRGRKAMGPEERRRVSARMKRYWDKRRERESA